MLFWGFCKALPGKTKVADRDVFLSDVVLTEIHHYLWRSVDSHVGSILENRRQTWNMLNRYYIPIHFKFVTRNVCVFSINIEFIITDCRLNIRT